MSEETLAVRGLWIKRKCDPDYPPELVEAWDQWSIEENYDGWREACDKALASIGDDLAEHRYIDMVMPMVPIFGAFDARRVEADRVIPVED